MPLDIVFVLLFSCYQPWFFFSVESAEYPGHSCGMLGAYQCGYGSYCENTHNGLVCRCDYIDCLRNPTGKYYICGSDGNTYESHCHMSFESCKEQKEITISYIGPCTGKDKTTCNDFFFITNIPYNTCTFQIRTLNYMLPFLDE